MSRSSKEQEIPETVETIVTVDTNFENLSNKLKLSKDVRNKAWDYWQIVEKVTADLKEISKSDLLACCIYQAVIDTRMPYGPTDPQLQCGYIGQPEITITDLLMSSEKTVTSLFQSMNVLRDVISISEAVKYHLTQLERKFCIVSGIFHTFERVCKTVFREEENRDMKELSVPDFKERKTLCWVLFLLTKGALLTDDLLVDAFFLLICCVEYIIRSTPGFQLNPPLDNMKITSTENADIQEVTMLQKLSEIFGLSFEEVLTVQVNRTEAYFESLPHIDGELNVTSLKEKYSTAYRQEGDIDEMMFLTREPHILPQEQNGLETTSLTNNNETSMTPVRFLVEQLSSLSLTKSVIDTEVRAVLDNIQELKNILTNAGDEPSQVLNEYFQNCSANPYSSILNRTEKMKDVFIREYVSLTNDNHRPVAIQRYMLAQRLYYRVMEAMLNYEKERLSQTDFSKLLNIENFHRSLLACSIEIVLMTYGRSWNPSTKKMGSDDSKFSFPWILELFKLHPYDFYKVLESFIKAEPVLTTDIIKHLQSTEIKILECLAWKPDSPLFSLLESTEVTTVSMCSPSPIPLERTSSAELYLSPMRTPNRRGVSPCPPSPRKPLPSPRKSLQSPRKFGDSSPEKSMPKKSQSLNLFINKVCRLGYHRLQQLCTSLQIPKDLQHKIWTCLEYCISRKPLLLKNRHLDQILLCSVYGICKVVDREIKFKIIVQMYRELPHAELKVYKNALIEGCEYDSIIGFYNKVFMQNMKSFILQFQASKVNTPALSPVPVPMSSPLASPVFSLPNRKHFYISPLKDSPFKAPSSPSQMTPRSRQLYSFGEGVGSGEKLQKINEIVYKAKGTTPKSHKRLRFEQLPDDSALNGSNEVPDPIVIKKSKLSSKVLPFSSQEGKDKSSKEQS
ncbi:retinoblastoma-associated protein-like isoform X1 [Mytilus edulis]|uniref:retinoblastoma-associated protein-like isoform X1 n=1 Tax=Mytilus edulis TaxID=6550 RepID=UPI0039F10BB6